MIIEDQLQTLTTIHSFHEINMLSKRVIVLELLIHKNDLSETYQLSTKKVDRELDLRSEGRIHKKLTQQLLDNRCGYWPL